jgi:hypothetical protein
MAWVRRFVVLLALIQGGFMIFDGSHALLAGDYVTPSKGRNVADLGPWANIVTAVGIPPRSTLMKFLFVAYGSLWLVVAYHFARGHRWGKAGMLAAAVGSLWYVGIATLFAFTLILILVLLPNSPREQENP